MKDKGLDRMLRTFKYIEVKEDKSDDEMDVVDDEAEAGPCKKEDPRPTMSLDEADKQGLMKCVSKDPDVKAVKLDEMDVATKKSIDPKAGTPVYICKKRQLDEDEMTGGERKKMKSEMGVNV